MGIVAFYLLHGGSRLSYYSSCIQARKKFIFYLFILHFSSIAHATDYDVSGYGDDGYVTGNIDAYGDSVDGYIYKENGSQVYFQGEWDGYGEIEGYDENGDYYHLEVD